VRAFGGETAHSAELVCAESPRRLPRSPSKSLGDVGDVGEEVHVTFGRELVRLSEIVPKSIEWVWQGFLPVGAITDLSGDPGEAKSRITYDLTARITTGQPMPGCSEGSSPAGVVLLQAEDDPGGVVRPTLAAAGADMNRVFVYDPSKFVGQPLELPNDIDLIEEAVDKVHAKLVVIDPVTALFTCNPNSEQAVRKALKPVGELAADRKLAVLNVRHLSKGNRRNTLYQAAGSIAWLAASRSALMTVPDPASSAPYRHLLVQTKTNNPSSASTLAYRTVKSGNVVTVEWMGQSAFDVRDVLRGQKLEGTQLWEAMQILYLILRDGPERAKHVIKKAQEEGVAKRTLERAKLVLGVKSERASNPGLWWWRWHLPDEDNPVLHLIKSKYEAVDSADEQEVEQMSPAV